ncbi:hypothetical protein GCM10009836_72630 [Pseudonocardia ailaonensis]|uniref:Uncharacterized protein n=1 Tax=Pseudonocardia ailaonensis TaxID=367279 RepID=A0ABN2NTQ1_9PSEU
MSLPSCETRTQMSSQILTAAMISSSLRSSEGRVAIQNHPLWTNGQQARHRGMGRDVVPERRGEEPGEGEDVRMALSQPDAKERLMMSNAVA